MRWALYDLRIGPPSFDFLTFLVLAKYHGANAVWIVPGLNAAKLAWYEKAEQDKRVESIVIPACKLYGMEYKIAPLSGRPRDWDIAWPPYAMSGKALHNGYMLGWLKSIREPEPFMPSVEAIKRAEPARGRIVVHLRKTRYQDSRNSGPDWERWAKDHDAYIVPDEPMPLDDRVALHEVAKLNMGVNSGPMVLSEYSTHRPYITLKMLAGEISTNVDFYAWQGWFHGEQFPWARSNQMLVWNKTDDYQSIEAAYQEWLANNP